MSKPKQLPALIENKLLAALSPESYERLARHLEPVEFSIGDVLYAPRRAIDYAYFPHKSTISVVTILKDRSEVELAVLGSEGMLGSSLLSGDDVSPHQAIVQVADGGVRISAEAFKKEIKRGGKLHDLVMRYSQALFFQVAQTAACNSLHPIVERLARWLLQTRDIMGTDTIELTHEFLAKMLSVQRSGVTLAAGTLQAAGIIKYSRGKVTILRRKELEEASCECYGAIKAEYSRLLSRTMRG